jgi:hypothetical protein
MAMKKSAGKSSATKTKKINVILKIRSLDPGLPPQVAAEKVAEFAPALSKHLKAKFGNLRVQVDRRKTFPVDPSRSKPRF